MDENKIVFVDYEGTLSEKPNKVVTIKDLLFDDIFENCQPLKKIQLFLQNFIPNNIYVLGVIDTSHEIEVKSRWLKKYYPNILKENIVFVSGAHEKIAVINEFIKNKHLRKENIIFIDDKELHLKPARAQGIYCLNVHEILD